MNRLLCFLLGHKPMLNGQRNELVIKHRLDGTSSKEVRLVEREWCGRCRKLLKEEVK